MIPELESLCCPCLVGVFILVCLVLIVWLLCFGAGPDRQR